jgi:hypothetical protein
MTSMTSMMTMTSATSESDRKEIGEERAAVLLGLSPLQLRKLCEQYRLGHGCAGDSEGNSTDQKLFTYSDLHKLCRWVVGPAV